VLGVATDITERKEAEQQIQMQNESLVRANRELAVARKQAEAASKLKSQFLATMSHELRTPLNAVVGYAQLQLAGMAGEMTDEQLGFQERILVNAQHLLQLINEVLDLSKIEAGRMELIEKPFNLRECLEEIMFQNRVLAEDKNLNFELLFDEQLPTRIIGDRGRIKQIIINLVSNAIKFTDNGSVKVDVGLHNKQNWRVTVTDTGAGISPTMQETIFDEFRQAENGIERGGTGLGLAIVRKLVLMMGGNIRLTSEVGRGSAFTITLPLITEIQEASELMEA
jgi:signal transduction histidine kinase